jgi:LysM repeat protein
MNKNLFLCLIFGLLFITTYSQITAPIQKVNGVEYYMHKVEKGQTLYGIAKQYTIGVKQIQLDNQLNESGIAEGQILKIRKESVLAMSNPTQQLVVPDRNHPVSLANQDHHVVVAGETFFSISQKYQLSLDELMAMNPSLQSGLHPGDLVLINSRHALQNDAKRISKDDSLHIVLMLPFFASVDDSLISPRQKVIRQTALQLYRGMLLSTDTLQKLGVKASIQIIDFENNTEKLKSLIAVGAFENVDVVIGPLFKESIEIAAEWAEKNNAWVVCPVPISNKVLMNNPHLIKAFPSDVSLWASTAKYVLQNKSSNVPVLIYKGKSEAEKKKAEAFITSYQKSGGQHLKVSSNMDSLITALISLKDSCVLIMPTNANGVFGKLNKKSALMTKKWIFGVAEWQEEVVQIEDLEERASSQLSFYYPRAFDYERMGDPLLDQWIARYHREYFSQPNEYSACGFDILMALATYAKQRSLSFTQYPLYFKGISSNSDWLQVGKENGFENVGLVILESDAGIVKRIK